MKKYPPELKERAVRLLIAAREDTGGGRGASARIGQQLGIPAPCGSGSCAPRSTPAFTREPPPTTPPGCSNLSEFSGWVYAAFVTDVFSRRVVGWQLSTSMHTSLALDALKMGIWTRQREGRDRSQLIHHSDRGVQYRAVRYTERLAQAEAVSSVGSKGDSYDNAIAEALKSLFQVELIRNRGPWFGINDLEIAVAEYFDWFNQRHLHGELGHIPPVEAETNFYTHQPAINQIKPA